jgi:integrase
VRALFDIYVREVTPTKGWGSQVHDRMCADLFRRAFGADRAVATLSIRDVERFARERRSGKLRPKGREDATYRVGDRQVQYDLQTLHAVLNWAVLARDANGRELLAKNPLKGLALPRERNPQRAVVTVEQYEAVLAAASELGPDATLAVVTAHETGHRMASIRRLRWSDLDLDKEHRVLWRGELDKSRFEHATPLTTDAVAALVAERQRQAAIGDAWVLPSPADPSRPWSRYHASKVWKRLAAIAKLPTGKRYGWHALRRQFASELKHTPLNDLCALGGWKSPKTVLECYIQPDEATQRAALDQRRTLRTTGLATK